MVLFKLVSYVVSAKCDGKAAVFVVMVNFPQETFPTWINNEWTVSWTPLDVTDMLSVPSGLQTDEGLQLMEILARMARIQMTDFAELS